MDILAPNVFFRDAEMKTMLFDPKNGELGAYLRKLEIAKILFFNPLKESKSNFSPQNHFFRGAEMEYLFFDPKNGALGTNTEKPLRVFSASVTSPNGHIGSKCIFS